MICQVLLPTITSSMYLDQTSFSNRNSETFVALFMNPDPFACFSQVLASYWLNQYGQIQLGRYLEVQNLSSMQEQDRHQTAAKFQNNNTNYIDDKITIFRTIMILKSRQKGKEKNNNSSIQVYISIPFEVLSYLITFW